LFAWLLTTKEKKKLPDDFFYPVLLLGIGTRAGIAAE
jgi:hypothetical protein